MIGTSVNVTFAVAVVKTCRLYDLFPVSSLTQFPLRWSPHRALIDDKLVETTILSQTHCLIPLFDPAVATALF